MPEFEIQVKRGDEWRKVTTVRYETDRGERQTNRTRAIRDGFMQVSEWRASDQFTGLPMRLAEPVGGRVERTFTAITRVGQ